MNETLLAALAACCAIGATTTGCGNESVASTPTTTVSGPEVVMTTSSVQDTTVNLSMKRDINPEGEKLVELLRISQKSAIFMDSDKESPSTPLDATKRRVIKECKKQKVPCVVTSGREIENDVGGGPIEKAYRDKYGVRNGEQLVLGRFDRTEDSIQKWLGQEWRPRMSYNDAKPMWSRLAAPHMSGLPSNPAFRRSLRDVARMVDAARRSQ